MPTQQKMSPIQRYARLTVIGQRLFAQHKPLPPALVREVQELEAWAVANFPPETVARMQSMVTQERARILQEDVQQSAEHSQRVAQQAEALRVANADTLARRFGRNAGLDVKNAEEFNRLRKGLPLKRGTPKPTSVDPAMLERATVNATRHLDVNGKGFTAKEWKDKLEYLWEYVGTAQLKDQARKLGIRPTQEFQQAITRYQEQELVERMSGPKEYGEHKVQPEERDIRRALITAKIAEGLARNGTDRELDDFHRSDDFREARRIHEDPNETDSLRGDVARALMAHYPEDQEPEDVFTYDDKDYEGDDDDE